MRWIDRLPLTPLIVIAAVLAVAPIAPVPHLWQKLRMLGAGELTSIRDILDLLLHGAPLALLTAKLARVAWFRAGGRDALARILGHR